MHPLALLTPSTSLAPLSLAVNSVNIIGYIISVNSDYFIGSIIPLGVNSIFSANSINAISSASYVNLESAQIALTVNSINIYSGPVKIFNMQNFGCCPNIYPQFLEMSRSCCIFKQLPPVKKKGAIPHIFKHCRVSIVGPFWQIWQICADLCRFVQIWHKFWENTSFCMTWDSLTNIDQGFHFMDIYL